MGQQLQKLLEEGRGLKVEISLKRDEPVRLTVRDREQPEGEPLLSEEWPFAEVLPWLPMVSQLGS